MRILLLILAFWLVPGLAAWAQEAECMVAGGKFASCTVAILENSLTIRYPEAKHEKLNQEIPGEKIQRVTQGKAEKHDAQQSLVLGPLIFLQMFDRDKRSQEMFGIDYLGREGKLKYLLIRMPPNQVYTFGTSLKKLRGETTP